MSVLSLNYTRSGFVTALTPPRPGIYYVSVAVFNALTQGFSVQNGIDQSTLAIQQAQLFSVPTTGSPTRLQPLPVNYPYGAYLGPIQSVWYESTDAVGSYPVTLGALSGLIQWTPQITIDVSDPIYVVPGTQISSVIIANASDTSRTITVTGFQSHSVLGSASLAGNTSVSIPLEGGTGDSVFAITADGPLTATVSLFVGIPPTVNGGSVGPVTFYASLTGPGETATPGDLTQLGGFTVNDTGGDGISLTSAGAITLTGTGDLQIISSGEISLSGANALFFGPRNATFTLSNVLEVDAAFGVALLAGSSEISMLAGDDSIGITSTLLGFYGATAVAQAAAPVTLGDVIAILTNLGLCAP